MYIYIFYRGSYFPSCDERTVLTCEIGKMWRNLSTDEKKKCEDASQAEKEKLLASPKYKPKNVRKNVSKTVFI